MTVIAAVVGAGQVHMAADSASVDGGDVITRTSKIRCLQAPETVLFGAAGRSSIGAIAQAHCLIESTPSLADSDSQDAWAQAVAESVTEACRERGHVDRDGDLDGYGLLAWRHRLWLVTMDLAHPVGDYHAIGSGGACALGSLWATPGLDPAARARCAIEAAITHIAGIAGIAGPVTEAVTD